MGSLALSDAVLAAASTFAVFLMFQQKVFAEIHRTASKGALLGFLLMALGAAAGTLNYGFSEAWSEVYLMLNNAAVFMSPALVGVAMILILTTTEWSKAAWGRLVLGLCVAYEVSRWYGLDALYRDAQLAVLLGVVFYMVIRTQIDPGPKAMILASFASFFVGALVIGNEGTLGGYLRENLFRYLIALGNLLLGSGLYMLLRNLNNQEES